MYMSLFSFSEEVSSKLSLSEKLESILTTGVGGYILVFVVLALIWLILELMGKIFTHQKEQKRTTGKVEAITNPTPAQPVSEPDTESDESAVIAAIVAAVSAYSDKPAGSFKVVSFRKKK